MAAVSLFWDTNMAAVTSCETLYGFGQKFEIFFFPFFFKPNTPKKVVQDVPDKKISFSRGQKRRIKKVAKFAFLQRG